MKNCLHIKYLSIPSLKTNTMQNSINCTDIYHSQYTIHTIFKSDKVSFGNQNKKLICCFHIFCFSRHPMSFNVVRKQSNTLVMIHEEGRTNIKTENVSNLDKKYTVKKPEMYQNLPIYQTISVFFI